MGVQSGRSIIETSRNENRENSPIDLRAAWVFCAADILFDSQALSFRRGSGGMDGFAVAALSRTGGI
jgi:hypothetical protein